MSKVAGKFTDREIAVAREMAKYENKWVAISKSGSRETVIAYGDRITDVKAAADKKGVKSPTFRKIPSAKKILIAIGALSG